MKQKCNTGRFQDNISTVSPHIIEQSSKNYQGFLIFFGKQCQRSKLLSSQDSLSSPTLVSQGTMLAFMITTPFPNNRKSRLNSNRHVKPQNKFTVRRASAYASAQAAPQNASTVKWRSWDGLKLHFVEVEVDRAGCGPADLRDLIEAELKHYGDPVRWSIAGASDGNEKVRVEGVVSKM